MHNLGKSCPALGEVTNRDYADCVIGSKEIQEPSRELCSLASTSSPLAIIAGFIALSGEYDRAWLCQGVELSQIHLGAEQQQCKGKAHA